MHLKTVVAKASNIVNFVRKSINASEILEGEKKLQASNATLWSSQLYMIKPILNVPGEKLNKTECKLQSLSGRVLDSRPKGCGFYPNQCHCIVVLEQDTLILA